MLTQNITPQELSRWLFTPFNYWRGEQALRYGLFAILIAGVIAYCGGAHFDGVLDLHFGPRFSMFVFMFEGIIDWLCASLVFLALGRYVFKSKAPVIEIFGTQALARGPSILSALAVVPPAFRSFAFDLVKKFQTPGAQVNIDTIDGAIFAVTSLLVLGAIVWMGVLMLQSFCTSFSLKITEGIFTFFVGLVLAEIFAKVMIKILFLII